MVYNILVDQAKEPSVTCSCGRFTGTQAQYEIHVKFEQTYLQWKIDQILLASTCSATTAEMVGA